MNMICTILCGVAVGLQLPGLGDRLPGIPGLDAIFKKGPAITTSLKDCKWEAQDKDGFNPKVGDLFSLERGPNGGFLLRAGAWRGEMQSYCLHAGTHGPGEGDGYIYAPPKGPYEKMVIDVGRNSVSHPEIEQRKIQVLLWAMIARTKFSDMPREMQATASKLLTQKQIVELNGGALGILSDDKIGGAFIKQPPLLRQVYEAEARIRGMILKPTTTYDELEGVAVLRGVAPIGKDSREVPAGRWSLHPMGFYVRYMPSGYPHTTLEIFVPEDSKAIGTEFDPATHIAVPGNTAKQRLLQTGRKFGEVGLKSH